MIRRATLAGYIGSGLAGGCLPRVCVCVFSVGAPSQAFYIIKATALLRIAINKKGQRRKAGREHHEKNKQKNQLRYQASMKNKNHLRPKDDP